MKLYVTAFSNDGKPVPHILFAENDEDAKKKVYEYVATLYGHYREAIRIGEIFCVNNSTFTDKGVCYRLALHTELIPCYKGMDVGDSQEEVKAGLFEEFLLSL